MFLKNGKVQNEYDVRDYCAPLKVGDMLEMELNMEEREFSELSFVVNGISKGIAFDKIPSNEKYTLCVGFTRRDKLELVPIF